MGHNKPVGSAYFVSGSKLGTLRGLVGDRLFCTVEVNQEKIVQARGYKNSTPGSEVQAFLKRFERSLQKKRTQAATAQKAS
jgi:hypothetical protein